MKTTFALISVVVSPGILGRGQYEMVYVVKHTLENARTFPGDNGETDDVFRTETGPPMRVLVIDIAKAIVRVQCAIKKRI